MQGALLVLGAAVASPALAQVPFSGLHAGPELGAHEHHFFLEERQAGTGATRGRYNRRWGVGGGAFAGYDLTVAARIRLGAEAGVSVGGGAPRARFDDGFYVRDPRWGYRLTGRAGYLLSDVVMAYGTFGYGGHRYRVRDTVGVEGGSASWYSSFVIGGGVEARVSPRIGLRLDFKHLDNSMSHILVGVPIRL